MKIKKITDTKLIKRIEFNKVCRYLSSGTSLILLLSFAILEISELLIAALFIIVLAVSFENREYFNTIILEIRDLKRGR